jgi:hypothetical protein
MSVRSAFLSPIIRKVGHPLNHTGSLVARRVRQTVRGASRAMNHPASLVALGVLAAMVASAWGYWYYETSIRRPQELTNLQHETRQLQNNLDTLRQSAEGLPTSAMKVQHRRGSETSLLSPMDGIRALDQLALLADRTGVDLSNVQLSPGTSHEVGEVELTVFDLSFTASGGLGDLTDFSLALEEGILPGLVIENIQTNVGDQESTSTASGSLFTLSTLPSGSPVMPVFLKAGTPAFDALDPEVFASTATDAQVLAFSVESLFDGMDALRSIRIQASHPQVLSSLKLYAEVNRDEDRLPLGSTFVSVSDDDSSRRETDCRPALSSSCAGDYDTEKGTLIATTATAMDDGSFIISPVSPFAFRGHREQRFYLTADLHSLAVPRAVVEVRIPPGGVTFTSGKWPTSDVAAPFISSFPVRKPPVAESR